MFEQRVNSDVLTVSTVNSQDQVTQKPLRDSVKQALKNYFAQLNGQDVNDLYESWYWLKLNSPCWTW